MNSRQATVRACANIALVKYWGKRDARLNLPLAGSISLTLDPLITTTTVCFGDGEHDRLVLDGAVAGPAGLDKARRVLDLIRERAGLRAPARIESQNAFPTAAGLASSASGLAALTVAAARAAGLELSPAELSVIARQGSGSACRSLFGGFVEWDAGRAADGSDSHGRPLHPVDHWDLRVVVAVISSRRKAVGSTRGMTDTRRTSPYLDAFVASVGEDLPAARRAIDARSLAELARVAERNCLRMHAAMLAADPPLVYLQPQSWQVIDAVRRARDEGIAAFFTADAGPNVKVFCLPEAQPRVLQLLEGLGVVERVITARPGPAPVVLEGP